MTYKLFIDDERYPPDDGTKWVIVRSSEQAAKALIELGTPEFISYDHDLGGEDTSMKFIYFMVDMYLSGHISQFPTNYYVHSQNPIGKRNIEGLLECFITAAEIK
jgi:hypothetical protein